MALHCSMSFQSTVTRSIKQSYLDFVTLLGMFKLSYLGRWLLESLVKGEHECCLLICCCCFKIVLLLLPPLTEGY